MQNYRTKFKTKLGLLLAIYLLFFITWPVKAQENILENFIENTPLVNAELIPLVFNIIRYVLGFLGVVAVVILIYGGFLWMTAGGNEEKVRKAKKTLINGLIGLIIILLSFGIVGFVMGKIRKSTEVSPSTCTPGETRGCYSCDINGLWYWDYRRCPAGPNEQFLITKIEPKGERNVRNSVIRIYFNKVINPESLDQNDVIVEKTHYSQDEGQNWIEINPPVLVNGSLILESSRIVKFIPEANCPSPNEDQKCFDEWSKFKITVKEGEISSDENPPKPLSCTNNKCQQIFSTSNIVDRQPPNVSLYDIIPSQNNKRYIPKESDVLIKSLATDDSGISHVDFYFDETLKATVENEDEPPPENIYSFTLNTRGLVVGSSHNLKIKAYDLDNNTSEINHQVVIRALHCFNNRQDEDEQGIDCGGLDCEACQSRGGPGMSCLINGSCSSLACPPAGSNYSQCVSFENECRCCCENDEGCQAGLTCDTTKTCWRNNETEIKGVCCGCTESNQCSLNEICKSKNGGANCCYACEIGDDNQPCHGGVCCTVDNQPICCHGRCVNHQCLTLCGNNQIDPNEECDGNNLNNKTCQDLGFAGGTLACYPDCRFDTTGCFTLASEGHLGDKCQLSNVCTEGAKSCVDPGTTCVQNETNAPCACCCDLGNNPPETDTCHSLNLVCDETKNCGTSGQKGLCCGCGNDDNKCCHNPPCIGVACKDNCCLPFPAPFNLQVIDPTVNQIKLVWQYSDPENLATHFEIYRKIGTGNYDLLTTCKIDELKCEPNPDNKFSLTRSGNNYTFVDTTGGFDRNQTYFFKVRAKKGTFTAYSDYTNEASGIPTGVISCQKNDDCPNSYPCCRTDTKQCVSWDLCQGNCLKDNRCFPPQAKFALADFWIQSGIISGPCLTKVEPNFGYRNTTEIKLTGKDFGNLTCNVSGNNGVVFYNEKVQQKCSSWEKTEIKGVPVHPQAEFGNWFVKVKKDGKESNELSFKVLKPSVGPGEACQEAITCPNETGVCNSPYQCLVYGNDCRCCCDPKNNQCQAPLVCLANVSFCTGSNRGLCCGCTNDNQCGSNQGCGFLDPNKCCYQRPTVSSIKTCQVNGSTGLNTSIEIDFSTLMDHSRLNKEFIKIYRQGNCESIQEGKTIENKCYLEGRLVNIDFKSFTKTVFYPHNCLLKPETSYTIEIIGGLNGQGVRSKMGVSLEDGYQGQFTTGGANTLCGVEWIDVQPRGPVIVREINIATNFNAFARDSSNNPVCVDNFNWTTHPTGIANLDPLIGLSTTATSVAFGETKIIASLPEPTNKTCDTSSHTCGILKVSLAGPQVLENSSCNVCQNSGQSPSPFKNSTEACRNALIVAKFNRKMKPATLVNPENPSSHPNIIVRQCNTDDFNETSTQCEENAGAIDISGRVTLIPNSDNPTGFIFKPDNLLVSEKIYRVTLKSGSMGIKDINGLELDGNKNGVQDGSPSDDYVWYFKTGQDEYCSLDKVCVYPPEAKITHSENQAGSQDFVGEVYTRNCNYLNASDYSWNWISEDEKVATVTSSTLPIVTATSRGLGETKIKGSASHKEDKANLIVATKPKIIENYPLSDQLNVCRNTSIKINFDQLMDHNSLDQKTIKFYKEVSSGSSQGEGVSFRSPRYWFKSLKNKISFWLKILFKKTEAASQPSICSNRWQEVLPSDYQIEIKDLSNSAQTQVLLKPNQILDPNRCYKVEIIGGLNGVKSRQPFSETMNKNYSWQFKTGNEICLLDKIIVDADLSTPGIQNRYLFKEAKKAIEFEAIPLDPNGQKIQEIPGSYEWSWSWNSSDSSIASVTNSDHPIQTVTSFQKNGLTTITAKATITSSLPNIPSEEKSGSALAEVFLCENPWPSKKCSRSNKVCLNDYDCPSGETCDLFSLPYQDQETNFEFKYCRDSGLKGEDDDLPSLIGGELRSSSNEKNKIKEFLFTASYKFCNRTTTKRCLKDEECPVGEKCDFLVFDTIGLKVFSNFDHLRPEEWFKNYAPGPPAGGSSFSVDGYLAYKVGRTLYVGATNVVKKESGFGLSERSTSSKIYSNIYLISYNDNAQKETINIFNQLISNWKFNINNIPQEDKEKLARDLERIYHLNDIAPLFENYKTKKGYYPKLESGSYIVGLTTSKWPSWNKDPAFNLAKELGGFLPVDPINKFANRGDCSDSAGQYFCCANCLRNNPQCNETCYNPENKKYECNPGSNVYQYQIERNGTSYSFFSKFEYLNPDNWQHGCENLDKVSCQSRHWCEWRGIDPNCSCQNKSLNDNSNICFNSRYYPDKDTCSPPK